MLEILRCETWFSLEFIRAEMNAAQTSDAKQRATDKKTRMKNKQLHRSFVQRTFPADVVADGVFSIVMLCLTAKILDVVVLGLGDVPLFPAEMFVTNTRC